MNKSGQEEAAAPTADNSSVYYDDYEYDYDLDESLEAFNWAELGPSLVVYSITFLLGVVGNILILVAVIRHTHVKNSPVNVFLASLASADLLLILICLPLKVAKLFSYTWTFGAFTCKFLYYMQTVSGACSVLNLTALSIERYYAIVHPLKAQYLCTISKAKKTVLFTWLMAFLLGIPIIFVQIHLKVGSRHVAYWCVRDFDHPVLWRAGELYLLAIILVVPTAVMSFSYGMIIKEVCNVVKQRKDLRENCGKAKGDDPPDVVVSNAAENSALLDTNKPPKKVAYSINSNGGSSGLSSGCGSTTNVGANVVRAVRSANNPSSVSARRPSRVPTATNGVKLDEETKQVIRMLISIVVTYLLCWGPLLTFNVLQSFGFINSYLLGVEKHLKTMFSLMAYFNSCLNPMIYGFMSKNFRDSFISEIRMCCRVRFKIDWFFALFRRNPRTNEQDLSLDGYHGHRFRGGSGSPSVGIDPAIYERNTRLLRQAGYTVTSDTCTTTFVE